MKTNLLTILAKHGMVLPHRVQGDVQSHYTDLFVHKICTPEELAIKLSQIFRLPLLDWQKDSTENVVQGILEHDLMRRLHCLPIREDEDKILIAVADPTVLPTLQKYLFGKGKQIQACIGAYDVLKAKLDALGEQAIDNTTETADYLNKILQEAIQRGASDLHFEFYEHFSRVRIRVDGKLNEITQIPADFRQSLLARIKVLSHLDITEKRVPQDGRLQIQIKPNQAMDFRVSTLPCLHGEKIVLRLLDGHQELGSLMQLGFEQEQYDLLLHTLQRPYGMILVCGPTGSGKTRTLYHILNVLNKEEVNIATVEDPVEIQLPGINQVPVNEKQGLNFAVALRALLRQDPDIMMVGEIRDFETADMAIKAAQTGHLLLSTLHTQYASTALTRLLNMGIPSFHLAASINLIVAQRLLRCLCVHCREEIPKLPEDTLLQMGFIKEDFRQSWTMYRATGCVHCHHKGYLGRTGIFELLPINEHIQQSLLNQDGETSWSDVKLNLRRAGLLKVIRGITSVEEVLAHT